MICKSLSLIVSCFCGFTFFSWALVADGFQPSFLNIYMDVKQLGWYAGLAFLCFIVLLFVRYQFVEDAFFKLMMLMFSTPIEKKKDEDSATQFKVVPKE